MSRLTKSLGDQVIIKDIGTTDCKKVCDSMNEYDNPCDMCIIDEVFRRLAYFEDLEEQGRLMEQKHGQWEEADDGDGIVCSVCGTDFCTLIFETDKFQYCPNCGVKMLKGQSND